MIARSTTAFLMLVSLASGEATLRFANGDRLRGQWKAITPEAIEWTSPAFAASASFQLSHVLDIRQPDPAPGTPAGYEAKIRLTNGDLVSGQLASVTAQSLELITSFAGSLTLRRPMIDAVNIQPMAKLMYAGPASADDWKISHHDNRNRSWQFKDGAFHANGGGQLFRDFPELPAQFQLSFQVAWRDRMNLRVGVCADDPKGNQILTAYTLYCQGGRVSLQKNNGRGNIQPMGASVTVPAFQQNEKAQCDLYVDRARGVVNLVVDGVSIGLWNDPAPDENEMKRGIRFLSTGSPLQLSQIRLYEWDGLVQTVPLPEPTGVEEFGEDGDASPPAAPDADASRGEEKRLMLRNGDSIRGEVSGIANDIISLKTPYREITLPISRLRSLTLAKADYERAKLMHGDVRAHFPDGAFITFRIDGFRDGKWIGYSQNFGTATIDPAAFSLIEFNIYDKALDAARKKE